MTVDFLNWVYIGGGAVALFVMVAERWEWFQDLAPEQKTLYSDFLVAVIALATGALLAFVPPELLAEADIYLKVVGAVIYAVTGKEIFYKQMYKK